MSLGVHRSAVAGDADRDPEITGNRVRLEAAPADLVADPFDLHLGNVVVEDHEHGVCLLLGKVAVGTPAAAPPASLSS